MAKTASSVSLLSSRFWLVIALAAVFSVLPFIALWIVEGSIVSKMQGNLGNEVRAAWNHYMDTRFREILDFPGGYAFRKNFSTAASAWERGGKLPAEISASWSSGNTNVNDLSAVVTPKGVVISGGKKAESLSFLLSDVRFRKIYSLTSSVPGSETNRFLICVSNRVVFAVASPLCDETGSVIAPGMQIFAREMSGADLETVGGFVNSDCVLRSEGKGSAKIVIPITDTFFPDNGYFLDVNPHFRFGDWMVTPFLLVSLLQLLAVALIILAFIFAMPYLRRLHVQVRERNDEIQRLTENSAGLRTSFQNLLQFWEKLNFTIDWVQNNVGDIQTNMGQIEDETRSQTQAIEQIHAAFDGVRTNFRDLSDTIERQSGAVDSQASAVEEIGRSVKSIRVSSEKTRTLSENLNGVAQGGGEAVKASVASIREVAEYSQQILKMLRVITDISRQTNLLAMNAAIEAAHAGEAGKGFAIVADEIRKLSENTNRSAREIGAVVSSITAKITESVELSEKAGDGLGQVINFARDNLEKTSELSASLEEQDRTVADIIRSIQDLVQITLMVRKAIEAQRQTSEDTLGTVQGLREFSGRSMANTSKHVENLNILLMALSEIREISASSQGIFNKLKEFLAKPEENKLMEPTAMKLVE
jgi:methyl-accepting chemotaxis protein